LFLRDFLFIFEVNMVKIAIIGCGLMGIKIAGLCLIIQSVIRILTL